MSIRSNWYFPEHYVYDYIHLPKVKFFLNWSSTFKGKNRIVVPHFNNFRKRCLKHLAPAFSHKKPIL